MEKNSFSIGYSTHNVKYSSYDVPFMNEGYIFGLANVDRSKPLRLKHTKELVEYVGYISTPPQSEPQIIVHLVNDNDPFHLILISVKLLENVPEENKYIYIKTSSYPFEGAVKVNI